MSFGIRYCRRCARLDHDQPVRLSYPQTLIIIFGKESYCVAASIWFDGHVKHSSVRQATNDTPIGADPKTIGASAAKLDDREPGRIPRKNQRNQFGGIRFAFSSNQIDSIAIRRPEIARIILKARE